MWFPDATLEPNPQSSDLNPEGSGDLAALAVEGLVGLRSRAHVVVCLGLGEVWLLGNQGPRS